MEIRAKHVGRVRINPADFLEIDREQLVRADFSGRQLEQFVAVEARFERCRFDGIQIRDACFGEGRRTSHYVECSFDGGRITGRPRGNARFERCSFRDIDIREWFCFSVEMIDCVFTGKLHKVVFNGSVPDFVRQRIRRDRNEFHGNDFYGAKLIDVAFRAGIDLTLQRLPIGPEYLYLPDARSAIASARRQLIEWTEPDRRSDALALLRGLESETEGGQEQLFLRPADFRGIGRRDVDDAVFDVLRAQAH